jgi:hypothetical protein
MTVRLVANPAEWVEQLMVELVIKKFIWKGALLYVYVG